MIDKSWRVLRFALVGAVNTGVYYGLYLALHLVLPYLAAHVLAFCLAMVGSYFLNCHFTFRTKPTWRKFLLFPLSNAANFAITSLGLYLLVDLGGLDSTYAPLPVAVLAIPVTFVVSQFVLVGKERTTA
ncbi:putative flippase GtrA [Crossiella equi]|uniref:Flippase GtrA n=1 Tax=Crossiella equi TaxID=130796 RepID=A0ABS5AFN8_9PSEU|nr:GtrA family protein [Crossiella equi]MBP2475395.1 putative flippase GtrA [Crossiella equi]